LIPYLQLQITGLGIIVNVASFDGIGRTPAMVISVALLAAFVLASGVRAVAWISILKDLLMLVAAVSIGIGIPYIHYGGIGSMFAALAQARPTHLTMPGATTNLGHSPRFFSPRSAATCGPTPLESPSPRRAPTRCAATQS